MSETEQVIIVKENTSPKKDAATDAKSAATTQVKYVARDPLSKLDSNKAEKPETQKKDVDKDADGTKKEQDLNGMVNDENGHVPNGEIPATDKAAAHVDSAKDVGDKNGADVKSVSVEKNGEIESSDGLKSQSSDKDKENQVNDSAVSANGDTEEYMVMHPKCSDSNEKADSNKKAADEEDEYVVMHPPAQNGVHSNGIAGGASVDAKGHDSHQASDATESLIAMDTGVKENGVCESKEGKSEDFKVSENAISKDESVPENKVVAQETAGIKENATISLENIKEDNEANESKDKSEGQDGVVKDVSKDGSSPEKVNGSPAESDKVSPKKSPEPEVALASAPE